MGAIRDEILALRFSGITRIAIEGLDDPDVIPLWFGESDIVTPSFISDAAKQALDEGMTFYNYARGHMPLREALRRYHQRIYNIDLDPDRITVPGSTMLSVLSAGQCLLDKGDECLMVTPCWPNITTVVETIGAKPVEVRLQENATGWSLDLAELKAAITPKTKAIYINSPSNPTGWVATMAELQAVLDIAREHGLGIIADEVYHRNLYDGRPAAPSFVEIASHDDPVFILNGFSKAWAMTGWRLGWMITPPSLAEAMAVLSECNNTGATSFTQYGGVAALDQGEEFIASFIERCRTNRQTVMEVLGDHPKLSMREPEGSFYAFPQIAPEAISGFSDGLAFARAARDRKQVGIAPGYTFGKGNERHVRMCFAIEPSRFRDAVSHIRDLLDGV